MARPKGSKNLKTITVEMIAKRLKCDPFEILCLMANGDWEKLGYENSIFVKETAQGEHTLGYVITPEMRLHAAKEACKYIYSQKRSVELSSSPENGLRIIVEDYTKKEKT